MADIYKQQLVAILGSRYDIGEKFAEGGMAKIYQGTHRALGKQVAIKVIDQRFSCDEKVRERFFKEAKLVANLAHKGIIDIYDFGSRETFDFIIMPFVEGRTLSEKLRVQGRLSCAESLSIVQRVAEALAFAHKRQVVHRDIKPSNILIDNQQQVVLTDFGICKDLTDPERTASCMILGSPKYMSPEQALGQSVDSRSDLYALGLVLYEMVTGQYPYKDEAAKDLLYMQVHALPPNPHQIITTIPKPVGDIVVKLLQKSPQDRYQTVEALLADIGQCDLNEQNTEDLSSEVTQPDMPIDSAEITKVETSSQAYTTRGQSARDGGEKTDHKIFAQPSEKQNTRFSHYNRYLAWTFLLLAVSFLMLYSFRFLYQQRKPNSVSSELGSPEPVVKKVAATPLNPDLKEEVEDQALNRVTSSAGEEKIERSHASLLKRITDLGGNKKAENLTLWSNQSAYRIGEKISYHFNSDEPCYLVLLNKTSDGNLVQVYPNKYDQEQRVKRNIEYSIPRKDSKLSLKVTGPAGQDELIALVSDQPFDLFPVNYETEPFFQLDENNSDQLDQTIKKLAAVRTLEIACARFSYKIEY